VCVCVYIYVQHATFVIRQLLEKYSAKHRKVYFGFAEEEEEEEEEKFICRKQQ